MEVEVKALLKLLDGIIRGARQDVSRAETQARLLFLSSTSPTAGESASTEDINKARLSLAVDIHNRARNIPAASHAEVVRAYMSATTARLLVQYCNPKNLVRASAKSMLLLARAAGELTKYGKSADNQIDARLCNTLVLEQWQNLPEQALSRVISAPEMEELQCDVLQSILALALSQAVSNPTEACTHVKTAAGLVELLPPESKLIFARNALGVVLTASTSEVIADEIVGPLRLISRSLDSIRHPSTDIEEEIVKLKLANLITLMRIYHESNLCDKGILALEQAEALFSTIKGQEFKSFDIKDSQVQFIWNKYLLLSKKGDIAESEKALRKIIMTIDEHDLILKAMRIAVNSGINDDIVGALYNSVLESFPNDSEFSKTRLAMLRAVVLRSTETSPQKEGGSASKETQDNSLKLANLMTGDHASGARILAPDTLASLRSLLEERIKYNHAMGYFSSALAWVGLLEELSITTDDRSGSRVAFLLRYKAELLSALGQIPAAYAAAESLIIIEQSTKSFVIFFRIAIDHLGAATAATHLPIWLHDGGTGVCETLFRIDMCMRVVEERGLEDALIVLQRQWMEYYCSQKAWTCSEEDPDGSSPRITTFATILCCHAELFNRLHVRKVNNDGRLSEEEKLPSPKKRRLMKASRTEQEVIMEDAVGALLNLNNSDRVIEEDIPYLSEEPRLEYLLAASLSDLHAKVLEPAGLLLKAADSMEEQHIKQLGNPDDFKWYANFIWNVGLMTVHQVGEVENLKPRMKLTSECAEMSSHVLRKLVHNSIQHVDCLVVAAAYRLDADSMLPQTKDLDSQENLRQALHDIEQARHSLKTWPDDDAKEFLNLTLIMRFTVLLRSGDKSAETYIDRHRNQLLDLSVKQLQHIAVICNQEANGSAFQGLEFLQLALQVCMKESKTDYTSLGMILNELIRSSPSRKDALQHIIEFEQLLDSFISSHPELAIPFATNDIDDICTCAYNYGLTLFEMNNLESAEIFMGKAIKLASHASDKFSNWKEYIDESYGNVLKALQNSKLQSNSSNSGDSFGQTLVLMEAPQVRSRRITDVSSKSLLELL